MGHCRCLKKTLNISTTKFVFLLKHTFIHFCITGLFFQSIQFLFEYKEYSTMALRVIKTVENVEMPTITVCNRVGIPRIEFCSLLPIGCFYPENMTVFCSNFSDFCKAVEQHGYHFQFIKESVSRRKVSRGTMAALNKDGIFLGVERLYGTIITTSTKFKFILAYDETGKQQSCHSLNSFYQANISYPYMLSVLQGYDLNKPVLNMVLDAQFYQINPMKQKKLQTFFAVHSPYELANPFQYGILLDSEDDYSIEVRVRETSLLSTPYKPECINYIKLYLDNNNAGPVSQKICIDECVATLYYKKCHCIPKDIFIPVLKRECQEDDNPCIQQTSLSSCYQKCKPDCRRIEYTYTAHRKKSSHDETNTFWNMGMWIALVFQRDVEYIVQSPRYESVEIFNRIGGYLGIWIGACMFTIYNWLETFGEFVFNWYKKSNHIIRQRKIIEATITKNNQLSLENK